MTAAMANMTTFGMSSSLTFFLRHRPEEKKRLIVNGFLLAASMGAVVVTIARFVRSRWLRQYALSIVRTTQ